eukprot:SAG11_NODE_13569_length_649_cov_1.027273_2_plen_101_part_01
MPHAANGGLEGFDHIGSSMLTVVQARVAHASVQFKNQSKQHTSVCMCSPSHPSCSHAGPKRHREDNVVNCGGTAAQCISLEGWAQRNSDLIDVQNSLVTLY